MSINIVPRRPIAVLMSTYGADNPELLQISIDSILNQNKQQTMEIRIYLAVDGPVPTALSKVLKYYEPRLYKLRFFPENRGLPHVLNDMISMFQDEELVFRMDSDDQSFPNRFIKQLEFMDAHPTIDILGTAIIEHVEASRSRHVSYPKDHETSMRMICWRSPFAHPTVCMRRQVLDVLGGYPTDSFNEDIALWFLAARAGFQFANLSEPLLRFSVTPGFWYRRGVLKAWGEFKCYVSGIYQNEGLTWRLLVPIIRLLFRLSPTSLRQLGYGWRAKV